MQIILSHSGKQHSYHIAKSLNELGYLQKFFTSSYITSKYLQDLLNKKNNSYWSRRYLTGLYGNKIESNWRFEIKEIIYRNFFGQDSKAFDLVYNRDINFDKYFSKKISNIKSDFYWGFQGSCFESLKAAKKSGKRTICELATAHVVAAKKILGEEMKLHPEWAGSIDNLYFPKEYERRLESEPLEADYIIGASEFTLTTLRDSGIPQNKLRLLPLGFDFDYIPYDDKRGEPKKGGPLKVLYAGKVTQRKGIKYLLESFKKFKKQDVELYIIGDIQGSGAALKPYKGLFKYLPPVHQYELFKMYQEFDAFVLPSVFEGFGLVIIEALAAGLPVITTPHTMGPEVIVDGENGYIVPIRNISSIENAIERLLSKSPDELYRMKQKARKSAIHFNWNNYQVNVSHLLNGLN
ncbi:hypothetical protein BH23BAC1_BH23BAC1_21070 [soil metagenome]